MKAVVYDRYGDAGVLTVRDVRPLAPPTSGEVHVRVMAAALNPKDVLVRQGKFKLVTGWRFPRGVGYDFAGTVIDGARFASGTRVYGMVNGWRSVNHKVHVLSPLRMLSGSIGIDPDAMHALGEQREMAKVIARDAPHQGASVLDLHGSVVDWLSVWMRQFLSLPDLKSDLPIDVTDGRNIDRAGVAHHQLSACWPLGRQCLGVRNHQRHLAIDGRDLHEDQPHRPYSLGFPARWQATRVRSGTRRGEGLAGEHRR